MEKVQCKLINKTDSTVVAATATPTFLVVRYLPTCPLPMVTHYSAPAHILFLLVSSPLVDWLTRAALTRGSPSSDGACAV